MLDKQRKTGQKRTNVHFARRVLNVTHCTKTRQKEATWQSCSFPNVYLVSSVLENRPLFTLPLPVPAVDSFRTIQEHSQNTGKRFSPFNRLL